MMNRVRLHPLDESVDLHEWRVRVLATIFKDRRFALLFPNDADLEYFGNALVIRTGWLSSTRYIDGQPATPELLADISRSVQFQISCVTILNHTGRSTDDVQRLLKSNINSGEELVWASCDGLRLHWENADDQILQQLCEFCQIEPDSDAS